MTGNGGADRDRSGLASEPSVFCGGSPARSNPGHPGDGLPTLGGSGRNGIVGTPGELPPDTPVSRRHHPVRTDALGADTPAGLWCMRRTTPLYSGYGYISPPKPSTCVVRGCRGPRRILRAARPHRTCGCVVHRARARGAGPSPPCHPPAPAPGAVPGSVRFGPAGWGNAGFG